MQRSLHLKCFKLKTVNYRHFDRVGLILRKYDLIVAMPLEIKRLEIMPIFSSLIKHYLAVDELIKIVRIH